MKQFDGFIFDIDGTLVSTNNLIFSSFNHVAKKYLNKLLSDEEIISLFGPTEDEILKDWMKENYHAARKDYFDFYSGNHEAMADLYPGIKEILTSLKNSGKYLSIYTGKGRQSSEITLKKTNVFDLFDMIVTGDDISGRKPSAEGIDIFVEKYKLDRSKILMVGDSPVDIKAAKNAGVKCASVVWDSYAKDEVEKSNYDYIFYSVNEFSKFIAR